MTLAKSSIANAAANSASNQIKVIADDQSTSEEFQTAFGLLSKAEHIYFLGFSYHEKNMQRLEIRNLPQLITSQVKKIL